MKFLTKYMLTGILLLHIPNFSIAQEAVEEDTPSNVQQLLNLVKEGQVSEQNENARREAEFLANKNEQAAILAAEKRELANQERIADQLEAEYKLSLIHI